MCGRFTLAFELRIIHQMQLDLEWAAALQPESPAVQECDRLTGSGAA